VDRGVWESQRLLDQADDEGWSPVADELIRDRAIRSVEHVFTMLALVLPRQPLRVAFRGLHTDDQQLRGTALEYLETALPEDIRRALWPFLEDHRTATATPRPTETVLRELLGSNQSIVFNLEAPGREREMKRESTGDAFRSRSIWSPSPARIPLPDKHRDHQPAATSATLINATAGRRARECGTTKIVAELRTSPGASGEPTTINTF
jgi:hypothetical protein